MAVSQKERQGTYRLEVPLNASGIEERKPDSSVKVVAVDSRGRVQEKIVKFDKSGNASAQFSFEGLPGRVKVLVGPENASAEQMQGLQTISADVLGRHWQGKRELKINPLLISPYYWRWWSWWCRQFKITGKVVCSNGQPVAGATVCAYDVDWWWWWWSQSQVGCATTDVNGSFEIDFTRCCGWWPWWWWEQRVWMLNPQLLDSVLSVLRRDPRFSKLPIPSPSPSLDLFQQLIDSCCNPVRTGSEPPILASHVRQGSNLDPAALDGLRRRLLEVLPPAPELERLRLWPWWPWYPWWDCDADIIFQVTQNCSGKNIVIVNETIWNTHWDIPTDFNLTLTANDQACCVHTCQDDCPQGNCLLPSDICLDNVGSIGGNEGATAAPVGLLNPGLGSVLNYGADRPYANAASLYGAFGDLTDVDYYELLVYYRGDATATTPLPLLPSPIPYAPLAPPAFEGLDRLDLVLTPSPHWTSVPFHVQAISDGSVNHYVIETIAHYETNNGPQLWDTASFDLLCVLNTLNNLANGTYYLQLRTWKRPGYSGNLTSPQILAICGTQDSENPTDNYWAVTIDNQVVTGGPNDLYGIPCGAPSVHHCTVQPEVAILQVQIQHQDGSTTPVDACSNTCIVSTDKLVVDFAVEDSDGYLAYYTLQVLYGASLYVDLLSLGGTLGPSPVAPPWAPATSQVGPDYASAIVQGATPPWWSGGSIRLTVSATAAFPETCAYTMQLFGHKRTIASCDHGFWNQYNVADTSFTIVNPCPQPVVG